MNKIPVYTRIYAINKIDFRLDDWYYEKIINCRNLNEIINKHEYA